MDTDMGRKRDRERDDSDPPDKRVQQTQNISLIYDIPDTKSVQELKAICGN